MPICPYAKRAREDYEDIGLPMVFCEQLRQRVTTTVFPCYGDFERCKYYKPIVTTKPFEAIRAKKRSCITCVYYSEFSKRCLKLDVEVSDPNKPPCERATGSTMEEGNPSREEASTKREKSERSTDDNKGLSIFRLFKKRRGQSAV